MNIDTIARAIVNRIPYEAPEIVHEEALYLMIVSALRNAYEQGKRDEAARAQYDGLCPTCRLPLMSIQSINGTPMVVGHACSAADADLARLPELFERAGLGTSGGGGATIDKPYAPQPGRIDVDEMFTTDRWGEQRLDHLRITASVRMRHEAVLLAKRRYPHAHLIYIMDRYGDAAEIEIPLRLTDDDVMDYLAWRDKILVQIYAEAQGTPT